MNAATTQHRSVNSIKGLAASTLLVVATEELGLSREALGARLSAEHSELLFGHALVPSGWYPLDSYRGLRAAVRELSPQISSKELGKLCALRDLSGVYRTFVRVLSPYAFLKVVPSFFNRYIEHGQVRVERLGPASALASWSGCRSFDRDLWQDIVGHGEAGLELCGAKHLRLHVTAGGGEQDQSMDLKGYWTA